MTDANVELQRLQASLAASGDLVYELDLDADVIDWCGGSPESSEFDLAGFAGAGKAFEQRIHPEDLEIRRHALTNAAAGNDIYECEYRVRGDDGEYRWYHDRGTIEVSGDGTPVRLRAVLRPIGSSRPTGFDRARLDGLASGQPASRERLREALGRAIENAGRQDTEGVYMVIGIDKLSMVNQAFGHEVADAVIAAIGDRLNRGMRPGDAIGRVDGDCFGAVLANRRSGEAIEAAEKVLDAARNTVVDTPAGPIQVTVSIGAVSFPRGAATKPDAMARADIALRTAKEAGRDCYIFYHRSEEQASGERERMIMAGEIHRALREDRVAFAYQPVVDSSTLMPRYHECLLRLIRPGGEVIEARDFIPTVEALGMIRRVDRRVMEITVDHLSQNPGACLAMNVSGLTTSDIVWLRCAEDLLRGKPEIAERIIVEITETSGLKDPEACRRFVSCLRNLGCRVALDDFGAGYTSFRHLKEFPVNIVKIDGSFIRNLKESPDNLTFVRTLLQLARQFNLDTVAECVETMDEVKILRDEGVEYLQGWAIGAPSMTPPWEEPAPEEQKPEIASGGNAVASGGTR